MGPDRLFAAVYHKLNATKGRQLELSSHLKTNGHKNLAATPHLLACLSLHHGNVLVPGQLVDIQCARVKLRFATSAAYKCFLWGVVGSDDDDDAVGT